MSVDGMNELADMRVLERAASMAQRVDLRARLARFQIDGSTKENLSRLQALQSDRLDLILVRLYRFLHQFPDLHDLLKGHDEQRLRLRQKAHWEQVLRCDFDRDYVRSCLMIGLTHFHAKIPPHSYMAAYGFFQGELLRAVAETHSLADSQKLAISIGKVLMLDMSLTLNAYFLDALAPHD
jgi:hypothetical protein